MQLVVVMAVRKAVSAATTTFTATSMILFFITHYSLFVIHYSLAQRCSYGVVLEHLGDRPISVLRSQTMGACPPGVQSPRCSEPLWPLILIKVSTAISTAATTGVDHEARSLSRHCEATAIHTLTLGQLDL